MFQRSRQLYVCSCGVTEVANQWFLKIFQLLTSSFINLPLSLQAIFKSLSLPCKNFGLILIRNDKKLSFWLSLTFTTYSNPRAMQRVGISDNVILQVVSYCGNVCILYRLNRHNHYSQQLQTTSQAAISHNKKWKLSEEYIKSIDKVEPFIDSQNEFCKSARYIKRCIFLQ